MDASAVISAVKAAFSAALEPLASTAAAAACTFAIFQCQHSISDTLRICSKPRQLEDQVCSMM